MSRDREDDLVETYLPLLYGDNDDVNGSLDGTNSADSE